MPFCLNVLFPLYKAGNEQSGSEYYTFLLFVLHKSLDDGLGLAIFIVTPCMLLGDSILTPTTAHI